MFRLRNPIRRHPLAVLTVLVAILLTSLLPTVALARGIASPPRAPGSVDAKVEVLADRAGSRALTKAAWSETQVIYASDDSFSTVVASATVTVTWSGPHTYSARMCLKDERRDGWGVRFQFSYAYTDGTWHDTRVWSNDNGYGSTVCHNASVDWPPDIYYMDAFVWATGAPDGSGGTIFFNPSA